MSRALRQRLFAAVVIPVISVASGFVVAGIAVVVTGSDPIAAFTALFQGAFTNPRAFPETLVAMIPYIFLGLAVALGFRAGLFNIGGQGQYLVCESRWVPQADEILAFDIGWERIQGSQARPRGDVNELRRKWSTRVWRRC